MPNYQFKCLKCEATLTVTQNINKEAKTPKCLACNKLMTRVFGNLAVQFKGGGWGSSRG
jgi:putative FmdB family regulatory protein